MSTMRDCSSIRPQLGAFVDGELDADTLWSVEKHCATCSVCARIAAELSATARMLRDLPASAPSADFDARLAARLADVVLASPRPSWRERFLRPRVLRPAHAAPPRRAWAFAVVAGLVLVPLVRSTGIVPRSTSGARVVATETVALEDIVQDHVHAASSEPLGGTSGMLLASTAGAPSGSAGY